MSHSDVVSFEIHFSGSINEGQNQSHGFDLTWFLKELNKQTKIIGKGWAFHVAPHAKLWILKNQKEKINKKPCPPLSTSFHKFVEREGALNLSANVGSWITHIYRKENHAPTIEGIGTPIYISKKILFLLIRWLLRKGFCAGVVV